MNASLKRFCKLKILSENSSPVLMDNILLHGLYIQLQNKDELLYEKESLTINNCNANKFTILGQYTMQLNIFITPLKLNHPCCQYLP